MNDNCLKIAVELRDQLQTRDARLVLAESCTAGRVAATLGCLPGISNWLCGSFVVYRCDSKIRWLGIPRDVLEDPLVGPVSRETTGLLAAAALEATPEARFALAVTGDIGPGAPEETDGSVFIALVDRNAGVKGSDSPSFQQSLRLESPAPTTTESIEDRIARLNEATKSVLQCASRWISES